MKQAERFLASPLINYVTRIECTSGSRRNRSRDACHAADKMIKEVFAMATPFTLAPLPWEENALEPAISARTIGFHYHKHHKGYVDTLNKLVAGTDYAGMKLEEIVRA